MKNSLILLALLMACAQPATPPSPPPPSTATVQARAPRIVFPDGYAVAVEVAADDDTRQQGLMFRDRLPEDRGMIFFFTEAGEYPFWMKNTLIPLDMIWLDEGRHIAHIAHDVPPCKADPCPSFPPHALSKYVLEVAAGVAAKHHLADGQVLKFEGLENVVVK